MSNETNKIEKRKFYVKLNRFHFPVPILDENGKKVFKRHPESQQIVYFNAKPIYLEENKQFNTVSNNPKLGYLATYETDNQQEIDILTEKGMTLATGGYVMTEEEYRKEKNPDLFKREQEMSAKEKKFKAEISEKDKTINELNARLAEATKRNR